jgi:hypothetical protein
MFGWLARAYRRRIVNVNVNILLANVLAVALTAVAVHFSRYLGITNQQRWLMVAYTVGVDMVFDVALYYVLHWMANHWPKRLPERGLKHVLEESPKPSFFKDATVVQAQRLCLSPLFYAITIVGMKLALHAGWDRVAASVAAFGAAIITTRIIHTFWMLRNDRAARRAAERNRDQDRDRRDPPPPASGPQVLSENGVKSVPLSK